jgi:hypothetical protein
VLVALPLNAQQPTPDLKLVPTDALAFVHVQVAQVWKSDAMKEYRKVVEKAGPKALAALDTDFSPPPSTIERVTMVVLSLDKEKGEPKMVTILAFSQPFDSEKVKKQYLPQAKPMQSGGKSFFFDLGAEMAVHFPDDRSLVFGDDKSVAEFLAMPGKADGPLAEAIAMAPKYPFIASGNVVALPLPPDFAQQVPEEFRAILKAQWLTLTAEAGRQFVLRLQAKFPNEADAAAGEKAIRKAAEVGRAQLEQPRKEAEALVFGRKPEGPRKLDELPQVVAGIAGLGGLNTLDEFLAELPLKQEGNALTVSVAVPEYLGQYVNFGMVGAGLALPVVQKVRSAAARTKSMNNLKQIALAMHNYESAMGRMPSAAICDKNGKPLLSWRVAILPYIEQENVYSRFKLDEPWDSEHNMKVGSSVRINAYEDPRMPGDPKKPQTTYYKAFVGPGAGFETKNPLRFGDFTDGTSNTVMVAAAGEPVVWWKPDDFEFDAKKKLPDVGKPFDVLLVAMFDGSVRALQPSSIKDFEAKFKAMVTRNGGEVIDWDR